jgi:ankyrin repeat protein
MMPQTLTAPKPSHQNDRPIDMDNRPMILRPGFNIKDRIAKVNREIDESYQNNNIYRALSQTEKDNIDKNDKLKKFYRALAIDGYADVDVMLQSGQITSQTINQNGALAMQLAFKNNDIDLLKTLIEYGGNPNSLNAKDANTPQMRHFIMQEQERQNHPVKTLFQEMTGLPGTDDWKKPRFY